MKVIIAGSRHMPFSCYPLVPLAVKASGFDVTEVVCGMAKGGDTLGRKWAVLEAKIPVKDFPANWEEFGKAAGSIRNEEMKEYADALIAFLWDGSQGTADMINRMRKAGKPVFVVENGELP